MATGRDQTETAVPLPPSAVLEFLPCRPVAGRNSPPELPFDDFDADASVLPGYDRELLSISEAAEAASRADFRQLDKRGTKLQTHQGSLWRSGDTFARSVAAKLREFGRDDIAAELEACHVTATTARCTGCGKKSRFYNRCDLFFCPRCAPRLSRERHDRCKFWVAKVKRPLHVVLTVGNVRELTREVLEDFCAAWTRLRRMVIWSPVRGGFYRYEVTNEGKGWHLHLHALVDADYLCAKKLSIAWGQASRGWGYIVKVLPVVGDSYLREVTKYVVKGDQLAQWSAADIACFVDTFRGKQTFNVFGSMRGHRQEAREFAESQAQDRTGCDCGCETFEFFTDLSLEWAERHSGGAPPPVVVNVCAINQLQFDLVGTRTPRLDAFACGA